jgi:hypothetical protein
LLFSFFSEIRTETKIKKSATDRKKETALEEKEISERRGEKKCEKQKTEGRKEDGKKKYPTGRANLT